MRWLSSDLYDYCTGLCSETSHGRSSVHRLEDMLDSYDSLERKIRLWSAELPTICGEYLLKTCVGCHPICMITELVCVLKLQHGRSSVPQSEDVLDKTR